MLDSKPRVIAVSVAALSLVLHIVSISLIGYLGVRVADNHRLIEELTEKTEEEFDNIETFQKESTENSVRAGEDIKALEDQAAASSNLLDDTIKDSDWIKTTVEAVWRVGCPVGGVSNGSTCFAIMRNKSNYTEAIENCSQQGGELAIPWDKKVLDALYDKFPAESYFVDAKYDADAGLWKTSKNQSATFLPWKVSQQWQDGNCAYSHRKVFQRWFCHAKMFYLCKF